MATVARRGSQRDSRRLRGEPTRADEIAAGRAAAERLSNEWPEVAWVPEAPGETWAKAAVERFAELISHAASRSASMRSSTPEISQMTQKFSNDDG